MKTPSYPVARAVAERIAARLLEGECEAKAESAAIEEIISAAFWASLRREEGKPPRISLVLVRPEQVPRPLVFETPLALAPDVLARLAPAVERPGIHLGVWRIDDRPVVWGTTRAVPVACF